MDETKRTALYEAVRKTFGMKPEDAQEIADMVADKFGEVEEVFDDLLEPTERSVFYTLEAKRLLSFRREEYTIENGEKRRGFWWRLRYEALDAKNKTPQPIAATDVSEDPYRERSPYWRQVHIPAKPLIDPRRSLLANLHAKPPAYLQGRVRA